LFRIVLPEKNFPEKLLSLSLYEEERDKDWEVKKPFLQ